MVAVNGSIISGLESGLVVALAAVLLGEIVTRAALVAIGLAYSFLIYNNVLSHVDAGWTAIVLNLITPS